MQYRKLKKDSIIVHADGFTPRYPTVVSINFEKETVVVLDVNDQEHTLPFDQIEICEMVDPATPIT